MDRQPYELSFTADQLPDWTCPACQKAILVLSQDSFHFTETAASSRAHQDDNWEPEWIEYVYTCQLKCPNSACGELVVSCGNGSVDCYEGYDDDGYPVQMWADRFTPKFFYPNLKMFKIPSKTPDGVVDELDQSFTLLFANPSSASNHVRIAVEDILTALRVKRYRVIRGSRRVISLHERITLMPTKYDGIRGLLLAVKWLGNAGSHSAQSVTLDDVLDAYEIMEVILEELYATRKRAATSLAKMINRKRGPKSRR